MDRSKGDGASLAARLRIADAAGSEVCQRRAALDAAAIGAAGTVDGGLTGRLRTVRRSLSARPAATTGVAGVDRRSVAAAPTTAQGRSWCERPAGRVVSAAIRVCRERLEFHHLGPPTRRSGSAGGASRCRSRHSGPKRGSASCCARTVTPKWRTASSLYPIQSTRSPESSGEVTSPGQCTIIRGSSIRQSIRLLTEGLWVRVPPPELHMNHSDLRDDETLTR